MTLHEARIIERECRPCGAGGGQANHVDAAHVGRKKIADTQIQGYTSNMHSMMRMDLEAGRFFSPVEEEHSAAVAIIGSDIKDQVFPNVSPLGQIVYIRGYPVHVIGLQARKGSILGQNQDNVIITPITFVQKILTASDEVAIYVRPRPGLAGIDAPQYEGRWILLSIRKTPYRTNHPFGIPGWEGIRSLCNSLETGPFVRM